mmetsp:Transcript_2621/g.7871  ORF Transcript_2621/g.7871 Transcript_2621/m.7871 type:complete len:155 (+) Transcript_2621:63-527(+)
MGVVPGKCWCENAGSTTESQTPTMVLNAFDTQGGKAAPLVVHEERLPVQAQSTKPPPPPASPMSGAASVTMDQQIQRLQGYWRNEAGDPMGWIHGSLMKWDASFQHNPSPLTIKPDGTVEMVLFEQVHSAQYQLIANTQVKLLWSDGDRWVRQQ